MVESFACSAFRSPFCTAPAGMRGLCTLAQTQLQACEPAPAAVYRWMRADRLQMMQEEDLCTQ